MVCCALLFPDLKSILLLLMADDESQSSWGQGLKHLCAQVIKRGTAMGSLVPSLVLVPIFLSFALAFRSSSLISGFLVIASVAIPTFYLVQFDWFKRNDPDRLQSEEHRQEMTRLEHMISFKGMPYSIPAERLPLEGPTTNPALSQPVEAQKDSSQQ